jgi:hemolysin III
MSEQFNNHPTFKPKPLLRGHFHQAAFFIALGACAMLISESHEKINLFAAIIYSLSLCGLFGLSALYHRPHWTPRARIWMQRLDHSAIFILIAGTVTPICLLAIPETGGMSLLTKIWVGTLIGILQAVFWTSSPNWFAATLYLIMGWLAAPYIPEMKAALGEINVYLILAGGIIYSIGAIIYATKKPNPWPHIFGYHEIFHILVIVAGAIHFIVINSLIK